MTTRTRPRIVEAVFGVAPPANQRRRLLIAMLAAVGAHFSLWVWAEHSERTLESWSAELAARVHAELLRETSVDLPKPRVPPPSEKKQKTEEPAAAPALSRTHLPSRRVERREKPAPPAKAGAIIAAKPGANAPVDLTGGTFVTGSADAYAGGATTSTGTSSVAQTGPVDPRASSRSRRREPDRSRPVSLEEQDWSCPWPRQADAEQIDEQLVVLRVVVRADGNVESAALVSDPGHGFGQAALACAKRTRFTPARDRRGQPILSRSPPIRVRFTR